MRNEMKKFGIKDQVGYLFGDLGGSMINLYISAYILTFCTYVLGISPGWMAGLFLFAKIWDAVNDPIIGSFPDRFRIGRTGDKFKPYIKIAMLPLAVSCLMIFADISTFSSLMKHAWIAVWYIIYGMSYTGTSMPYGAMASVITHDPDRTHKTFTGKKYWRNSNGTFLHAACSHVYLEGRPKCKPRRLFYPGGCRGRTEYMFLSHYVKMYH